MLNLYFMSSFHVFYTLPRTCSYNLLFPPPPPGEVIWIICDTRRCWFVAAFCRMWDFIKVPAWGRAWNVLLISYSWQHSFWDERWPLRGRRKKDLRVQLLLIFFFLLLRSVGERARLSGVWRLAAAQSVWLGATFWTAALSIFFSSPPQYSSTPALIFGSGLHVDSFTPPLSLYPASFPVSTVIILKGPDKQFGSERKDLHLTFGRNPLRLLVGRETKMSIAWISK